MDYQPMGQTPNPVTSPTPEPAMNQVPGPSHNNGIWYIVAAAVVVALGLWYYYGMRTPAPEGQLTETQASTVEQTQLPALTGGNTTADIAADLNQIPDTAAALDAAASASAQAVQSL